MTPQSHQLPPGTVLFGTYEITGVLGGGGMGWVYRAIHRSQGSPRAIKVIRPDMVSDPAIGQLFNREATALLQIQDEAIVRCFDQLQDENGVYLVMELVQGDSLEEILKDGPLNTNQVIALKRRVAQGLAAAHKAGIVHRDISPGNIILPGGRVEDAKLIDFGVAAVGASGEATIVGFKGKLAYASPEQFGLFGGKVGTASDIYSFGLVLAEAAGGRAVPMGQTFYEALEIRKAPPKLPLNIPPELLAEIEPMLQADPRKRPASGGDLLKAAPPAAKPAVAAPRQEYAPQEDYAPEQTEEGLPKPAKFRRGAAIAYSGSAILVGLLLGCYLWIYRSPSPSASGTQPSSTTPSGASPTITSPGSSTPQQGTPPSSTPPSSTPSPSAAPPKVAIPTPAKNASGGKPPTPPNGAGGITRVAMLARADQFANASWVCGPSNRTVSCARAPYKSPFQANQSVQGVPYRWGGIDGPEELTPKLRSGFAAGSHSWNGVLTCATGVDCSGFVCQVWGLRKHDYSTQTISKIADPVQGDVFTNLKPGDALNLPGSHVVLFAGYQLDGRPIVYEASGPASRVIRNERSTWARFQHYQALRSRNVSE